MKQTSLKVLTLVAVLATAGLVVAQNSDSETTLNQITAYRQWTRVNRKPVEVAVTETPIDVGSQQTGI
jgi:hypothetical protein